MKIFRFSSSTPPHRRFTSRRASFAEPLASVPTFLSSGGDGEVFELLPEHDDGLLHQERVLGRRRPIVGHGGIVGEMLLRGVEAWGFDGAIEGVGRSAEEVEDERKALGVELWGASRSVRRGRHGCTHVDTVELLVLLVLCTVGERHALAAEHEPVGKEAEEDGLGEVHDRLAVDGEALAAQVELEAGEEVGLEVGVQGHLGPLRDLGDGAGGEGGGGHGGSRRERRAPRGRTRATFPREMPTSRLRSLVTASRRCWLS